MLLNDQELKGLMSELLVSHDRPRGTRRLEDWLLSSAETLGTGYASELDRHWRSPNASAPRWYDGRWMEAL